MVSAQLGISGGEGWVQFGELGLAFALSALIGLERELRQKSAGLRTHTLVGVAAALIVLVSKYGFADVLVPGRIVVDPSRVAAQIVSGIGFLGAGLIFVRRDAVRGLTTAAAVWVTAVYFIALYGLTALARRLPTSRSAPSYLRLDYTHGSGALRRALEVCTAQGFQVSEVNIEREETAAPAHAVFEDGILDRGERPRPAAVTVMLVVYGTGSVAELAARIQEIDGVISVNAGDANASGE